MFCFLSSQLFAQNSINSNSLLNESENFFEYVALDNLTINERQEDLVANILVGEATVELKTVIINSSYLKTHDSFLMNVFNDNVKKN